jgi:hypothetical protein
VTPGSSHPTVEQFIERFGTEAPEVIWTAALAWMERSAAEARKDSGTRWRYYPHGALRHLRRDVAGALLLARFAAALQEQQNAYALDELAGVAACVGDDAPVELDEPATEPSRLGVAEAT